MACGILTISEKEHYILRSHTWWSNHNSFNNRNRGNYEGNVIILIEEVKNEYEDIVISFEVLHAWPAYSGTCWLRSNTLNCLIPLNNNLKEFLKKYGDTSMNVTLTNELAELVDDCVREYDEFLSYTKEIKTYTE